MGGESALEGARSFVGTQVTPPFSLGAHLVLHMLLTLHLQGWGEEGLYPPLHSKTTVLELMVLPEEQQIFL